MYFRMFLGIGLDHRLIFERSWSKHRDSGACHWKGPLTNAVVGVLQRQNDPLAPRAYGLFGGTSVRSVPREPSACPKGQGFAAHGSENDVAQ